MYQLQKDHLAKTSLILISALGCLTLANVASASVFGTGIVSAIVMSALVLAGPIVLYLSAPASRLTAIAVGVASMGMSGLMIHFAQGMIEMHFAVFVLLALLVMYGEISVILAAAVTIALHHVGFYFFLPSSLLNYDAGFGIIILHAAFVIGESALLCVVAYRFNRLILGQAIVSEELESSVVSIKTAVGSLESATTQLADGAQVQAASVEETSSAIEQLSETMEQDTAVAKETAGKALRSKEGSDRGAESLGLLRADLKRVVGSSEEMQSAVDEIKDSSEQVLKIVKSIDEIAFQTNILALNAAVEAARAGEAGAGFAVVADEVRSLAKRAANAASETAQLIDQAVQRSAHGSAVNTRVNEYLSAVDSRADDVSEAFEVINSEVNGLYVSMEGLEQSVQNQLSGTKEVNTAISSINHVIQEAASTTDNVARESADIRASSDKLYSIVLRLNQLMGNKAAVKSPVINEAKPTPSDAPQLPDMSFS